jgi:hypothetical protein
MYVAIDIWMRGWFVLPFFCPSLNTQKHKIKRAVKNGQSRDTGDIGHETQKMTNKK